MANKAKKNHGFSALPNRALETVDSHSVPSNFRKEESLCSFLLYPLSTPIPCGGFSCHQDNK